MFRAMLAAGLVATAGNAAFAQLELKTNEPQTKGIILENEKPITYSFEVKNAGERIRFLISSETAAVSAGVERNTNRGNVRAQVEVSNGNGVIGNPPQSTWGRSGKNGRLELVTTKPVPAGKYTIIVLGADRNQTGPYSITLLEPKFAAKEVPGVPPVVPSTEVAALKKDVEVLRKQVELLSIQVERLNDLLLKRK